MTTSENTPVPGPVPEWKPGDRVEVELPDRNGIAGRRGRSVWFAGTVRGVDEPGLPPGVRVDLDEMVNGAGDCYATHAELRVHDA
jgi:hypothetical protein